MRLFLLLIISLLPSFLFASTSAHQLLNLGVFSYRDANSMKSHYQPLEDYLNRTLDERFSVQLHALTQQEMEQALRNNQLDFILTNPSHYLVLRSQIPMTGVLATLVRRHDEEFTSALGGVIVVDQSSSIYALSDLRGKRIGIAGSRFLGGFQAQMYELYQQGIKEHHLNLVEYYNHDRVINALLQQEVDAVFIRTGILEDWVDHDKANIEHLRVINDQQLYGYPFAVSTRLYPEWPLLSMPHLDQEVIRNVANAFFSLAPDDPASIASDIYGFMPAADYSAVENMARTLKAAPFDFEEPIQLEQLWHQYQIWIVTISLLFCALLVSLLALMFQSRHLRQQRALLAYERQCLSDVIWGADVGTWEWNVQTGETRFNEKWAQMLGYTLDELAPVSIQTWINFLHPDDHAVSQKALQGCFDGDTFIYECEVRVKHKQGHWIWILDRGRVLEWTSQGEPLRMSGTHLDVTQRKKAQEKLKNMAYYDALTHLPNRVLLTDRLALAMSSCRRHQKSLAVVYIDLDGFKAVNDELGHNYGDLLLIEIASRIRQALRETDTSARIGGDEFVLLLTDLDNTTAAYPAIDRVMMAIAQPVPLEAYQASVTASMGVVFYPETDDDAEHLLRYADQSMYEAKKTGKNRYAVYSEDGESVHVA